MIYCKNKFGEVYKFLSDLIYKLPIILIIIDEKTKELDEAVNNIRGEIKIREFKTFDNENKGVVVHAHLFESLEQEPILAVTREETKEPTYETMHRIYPTLDEKLNMIKDEEARSRVSRFIQELKENGMELFERHDEWLTIWYGPNRIATLGCKKKFFVIETKTADGWKRFRIVTKEDYDRMVRFLKDKAKSISEGKQ